MHYKEISVYTCMYCLKGSIVCCCGYEISRDLEANIAKEGVQQPLTVKLTAKLSTPLSLYDIKSRVLCAKLELGHPGIMAENSY